MLKNRPSSATRSSEERARQSRKQAMCERKGDRQCVAISAETVKSVWKRVIDLFSTRDDKAADAQLRTYDEAPEFLRQNPFILKGYRCNFALRRCARSAFEWNNETLNIWTHLSGFFIMLALFVHDLVQRLDEVSPSAVDRAFCVAICLTYMTTLLLSVVYHTFNCHSEQCYQRLLKWDVLGVALSLSMTFLSGVHFAFSCRPWLELAYSGVEVLLVAVVLVLNFAPRFAGREDVEPARLLVLSSLVLFGLVPTAHWFALNGGLEAPIVRLLLPRIAVLFGLIGMAFAVYRFKIPECLWPGRVDYVFSSHQIWHVIVFLSLVWWHETGFVHFHFMSGGQQCAVPT
ncbi:progestin and adipoQ receptor family member 3 [Rhipicephalus microplus]|uniref:progestin and adipoQ receptor family member 3 n=1 Tax=Rhipicephalus microplus TaxID=6941 RepID=UPI0023767CD0